MDSGRSGPGGRWGAQRAGVPRLDWEPPAEVGEEVEMVQEDCIERQAEPQSQQERRQEHERLEWTSPAGGKARGSVQAWGEAYAREARTRRVLTL